MKLLLYLIMKYGIAIGFARPLAVVLYKNQYVEFERKNM